MEREAALSIDEIKGELELRGVDFTDCFTRTDLIMKLIASRATGKVADAEGVLDQFNQMAQEGVDDDVFTSEVVQDSVAGDGALPGGMDPAMVKMLSADPEIMGFLREPKFQAIMKSVMTGGPDAIMGYLSDPQAVRMLQAISAAVARVQSKPPSSSSSSSSSASHDDDNVLQ